MTIPLEIKAAAAGVATSGLLLILAFAWAGALRNQGSPEKLSGNQVADEAKGRRFFVQSCAHCHGRDADGGEDAPSLLKLQISGAHMALVIQNGIQGEMPSFAKKYPQQDVASLVAYLKSLH